MSEEEKELFKDVSVTEERDTLIADREETPDPTSPEWAEWVMTLFDETELVEPDEGGDPMPRVTGLRRVAKLLFGRIVFSGPTMVFPATNIDHPGRATVVFNVEFEDGSVYSEVGESYIDNTNDKVAIYPAAVASTRAEARALRKALGINRVSFDEITNKDPKESIRGAVKSNEAKQDKDGEYKDSSLATDAQSKLISFVCDKLSINRNKFFSEIMKVQDDGSLSKSVASSAIDTLHRYRDEKDPIPDSIKK